MDADSGSTAAANAALSRSETRGASRLAAGNRSVCAKRTTPAGGSTAASPTPTTASSSAACTITWPTAKNSNS
ncbi:hypothetical protein ACFPRL_06915 [Pseudoclavibacter helvolus]